MPKKTSDVMTKEDIDEMSKLMKERFSEQRRNLDRQIRQIRFEESNVQNEMKLAARRGDTECARILARAVVQAQHGRRRLEQMGANLQAMSMSMQQALSQARVIGLLNSVTPALKQMADTMNTPEQRRMFMGFQRELQKLGMVQELQDDSLNEALGIDELSDVAEAEVEKAMEEVINGVTGSMAVPKSAAAKPEVQMSQDLKAIVGAN